MPPRPAATPRLLAGREAPRAGTPGRLEQGARGHRALLPAAAARAVRHPAEDDPGLAAQIERGCVTRQSGVRKKLRPPSRRKPLPPRPRGFGPEESDPSSESSDLQHTEVNSQSTRTQPRESRQEGQETLVEGGAALPAVSGGELGIQGLISQTLEMPRRPETSPINEEEATQDENSEGLVANSKNLNEEAEIETRPRARRKATRASSSLGEKRRVLEHLAGGNKVRDTIEHFYPKLPTAQLKTRRNTILNWRHNAAKIMAGCADLQASGRRKMRPCGLKSKRVLQPEDVVTRLLSSTKKAEQFALKKRGKDVPQLVGQQQLDTLVFAALGLPPTTQLSSVQPPNSVDPEGSRTEASAPTMRPLKPGETQFAIRRR
ncbi:hypothetical protein BBJ28_00006517 [Nothophytophthora sp. Chile5]|nr:hypothetical protein BBJ28_00006517 [Nothophytophthora sp. Chile5]